MKGPWRITLDTNPDDCNLHCSMCEEHSIHSGRNQLRMAGQLPRRRMEWATVETTLREAAENGLQEVIPATMGEPLLWRHFEQLVTLCDELGLKLNLTTNGTFPRLGVKAWAHLILPVASDIKISWNGATQGTQEAIMVGTQWAMQLANLKQLLALRDQLSTPEHRPTITLQATFMQSNLLELPGIVQLASTLGVDRVKGHHLWVHWQAMAAQDLRASAPAIHQWNEVARECRNIAAQRQPPLRLDNFHDLNPMVGRQAPMDWPCPFLGKEAWVNAQGRFDPCCAPDQQRQVLGNFGNVTDGGLMAIWQGKPYRDLMANHLQKPLCQTCTLRRPGS